MNEPIKLNENAIKEIVRESIKQVLKEQMGVYDIYRSAQEAVKSNINFSSWYSSLQGVNQDQAASLYNRAYNDVQRMLSNQRTTLNNNGQQM